MSMNQNQIDALGAQIALSAAKSAAIPPTAQPEQEPPFSVQQAYAMAQVCLDIHAALGCAWGDNVYLTISQLKASSPQPEQEPVAWMIEDRDNRHFIFRMQKPEAIVGETLTPLYTTPPKRPWVGLKDEEIIAADMHTLATRRPQRT